MVLVESLLLLVLLLLLRASDASAISSRLAPHIDILKHFLSSDVQRMSGTGCRMQQQSVWKLPYFQSSHVEKKIRNGRNRINTLTYTPIYTQFTFVLLKWNHFLPLNDT